MRAGSIPAARYKFAGLAQQEERLSCKEDVVGSIHIESFSMKDVPGYEEYFSVTDDGDLFSKRTGVIMRKTVNKNGYYQVATKIGGRCGKNVAIKVHRAVAEAFVENRDAKPYVNHIDGNKLNNSASNLEWCTASENTIHAYSNGLIKNKVKEYEHGTPAMYKSRKCRCEMCVAAYAAHRKEHHAGR